jgi:hypothetical protein
MRARVHTRASTGTRFNISKDNDPAEWIKKKPHAKQEALSGLRKKSDYHEAPVEDGFMLIPESLVTPAFQVIDFVSHQNPDSLS